MVFKKRQAIYFVLQQDSRGHLTFMAVNREIENIPGCDFMEPGFPAILTKRHLKSRERFCKTRQMTGWKKRNCRCPGCAWQIPFCYKENCLLYIPEHLRPMKKSREGRATQADPQSGVFHLRAYAGTVHILYPDGKCAAALRDQIPFPMVQVWRNSQKRLHGLRRWRMQCCSQPAPAGKVWTFGDMKYRP